MRWHFNAHSRKMRKQNWHRCFAWLPVEVDRAEGTWCWLCVVERMQFRDEGRIYWCYRDIGPKVEIIRPGDRRYRRWTRSDDWLP